MPYIKDKEMRNKLDKLVDDFLTTTKLHLKGNLNFFLYKLAKDYCFSYEDYRDFIGELECAKAEIIRRQLSPYEDKKIKENGDVE